MKKFLVGLTIVLTSFSANAWEYCAASPSAFGVGISPHRATARNIALAQCRMRTPQWEYCVIVPCP